ncbi:hypothetical protein CYFUS_001020 [Cystobacter fuscus]|uniref:Uncharacterized protein n=1 Tax=Cystobacter fuscus TaxID=43 RepID=A0A250IXH4_9BACT|nr:hypothetical protein CYFUS_001020 [Cystobacter fuscus]
MATRMGEPTGTRADGAPSGGADGGLSADGRVHPTTLTALGLEALAYLLREAQEHARDKASLSGVVDEALQQLARSRGWQPSAGQQ